MTAVTPDSATTLGASVKPPPATEGDPRNPIHNVFWKRHRSEVEEDLTRLRTQPLTFFPGFKFYGDLESIRVPGAWVVSRLAPILEVSRNPQIYSSASGVTINDFPPEFNEYFNSIIAMDDPRHARLRRLVSAGFTPRMLARLEDSVQDQARLIVDEVCERGECDFVTDVAARLPLRIVCDLMGIPASQHDFVFDQSNVILGAGDSEYVPDVGDLITAILTAGGSLTQLMDGGGGVQGGGGRRRPDQHPRQRRGGRRAAHPRRARQLLHPAGGGGQ